MNMTKILWPRRFGWVLVLGVACKVALAATPADPDFGAPTLLDTVTGTLAVYAVGDGPKTVLLWPSLFADHRQYRAQVGALKAQHRVLVVDGPGHGSSSAQRPGSDVTTHAKAALQILDRFSVDRAVVVGTSWGGLVAAQMARSAPNRVGAMVLMSAALDTRAGGPTFGDHMAVWGTRWFGHAGFYLDGVAENMLASHTRTQGGTGLQEFRAHLQSADRKALSDVVRTVMLERSSAVPWLGQLSVPTVVVAGAADASLPAAESRRFAQLIPNARYVEMPKAAHLISLDEPEAVTELIREAVALSAAGTERMAVKRVETPPAARP